MSRYFPNTTLPVIITLVTLTLSACMTPGPFPQPETEVAQPEVAQSDAAPSVQNAPPLPQAGLPAVDDTVTDTVASETGSEMANQIDENTDNALENEPVAQVNPLTSEQEALLAKLQNYGPAPELTNEVWFNSAPLQLADLRGNVVIVEFWTYG